METRAETPAEPPPASRTRAAAGPSTRERLLERVADHVLEHGAADTSLSSLARTVDSSNRMLLYHFGSKDALLQEAVLTAFRRFPHLAGALDRLGEGGGPLRDRLLRVWQDIAHPDNTPFTVLFFQAFGVALYRPEANRTMLQRLGFDWVAAVRAVLEAEGMAPEAALPTATQLVAAWRGLQFALLTGADRAVLAAAHADLVARAALPGVPSSA